jgi:hypothetical protein
LSPIASTSSRSCIFIGTRITGSPDYRPNPNVFTTRGNTSAPAEKTIVYSLSILYTANTDSAMVSQTDFWNGFFRTIFLDQEL